MPTPPAPPTLNLTAGSDTGLSHTDDITGDTTPVVIGTAAPGSVVTLADANSTLGLQTRADKNGNFQFDVPGLADGLHTLSAIVTDAAGNFSDPATLNIDVETTATATSTAAVVPETATSITFAVHVDEPVSTLSPTSFLLATTGTAYGNITSVSGSGEDYTVTAAGLGGEGSVGLQFSQYNPTDAAGNQVVLTSSIGHTVSDTTTQTTTLVSADQFGALKAGGGAPAISGGGRLVAFISDDPNLVPSIATTPGVDNIYVKDVQTGAITLVTNGDDDAVNVQLSNDGTVVAFTSLATNLVPGGTATGAVNLYVAQLTSAAGADGLSFVPGSIKLVGTLDADIAAGASEYSFALSGDGSTVAFGTGSDLPGNAGTGSNSYTYTLATGAYTLIPGANSGEITSISNNGTVVAYNEGVVVPDTGGEPNPYFGGVYPPDYVEDALVYNTVSKVTTTIDGTGLLGTTPPTGPGDVPGYLTLDPVLSGNGAAVTFQLARGDGLSSLFSVALNNPSVFTPVSPGAGLDGSGDYDSGESASFGGGIVAYTNSSPAPPGITGEVFSTDGNTTTGLGPALATVVSAQGNAVALLDYTDEAQTSLAVFEVSLGVSASIAPVDGNDEIDRIALAQAMASGLTVSGTSNAPVGSPVLLYVTSATMSGKSDPFTTAVGDDGQWIATLPEEIAALLTEGPYFLTVQVIAPTGASSQISRLFTVDTVAPSRPTAPVLDQASNTGKDGVDTNDTTPTLDGQTEPGAFVTLYDMTGGQTKLAMATADQNGIYTLTSSPLADGSHALAVQAADAAGNLSALSATTTIKVDTVPPLKPSAPALAPGQADAALVEDTVGISRPVLVGSTEPNDTITLYDGNTPIATVKAAGDGSYTIATPILANGDHSLVAVATDPAGNVGPASDPLDLSVDTVPPGAPLLANVNGATLGEGGLAPSFTVTGVAAAQTTVTLQVDGVLVDADSAGTRASGAYTIAVPDLSPGVHSLSVVATDGAGNVSQPSAAMTVTISGQSVGIPGPVAINGVLLDGPIAGATVFADANGNGVLDAGEASASTTVTGAFALPAAGGELIGMGGIDTQTGVTMPGPLTAPAGSGIIDPLTTLLDAYAAATGQTAQAAQPALSTLLGLDPTADLTQLNPEAAAAAGDDSFLIASATVMDTAVVLGKLAAAQAGVSQPDGFAASFAALAQQAATGSLDFQNRTMLAALAAAAIAIAHPGAILSSGLADDAAAILDSANYDVTTASHHGSTSPLAFVNAVEQVDQGEAAPQFAAASGNQNAADAVAGTYSSGLPDQVTAAETGLLAAPVLARASDTGVSAHDNATADTTVTFTGAATPGATVILTSQLLQTGATTVVGAGTADAGGAYAIAATLGAGQNDVVAMQAAPGQAVTVGDTTSQPAGLTGTQVTGVVVGDLPEDTLAAPPTIGQAQYATSSANTATQTSLYITGAESYDIQSGASFTVTANGVPVSVGAAQIAADGYGILTTPLAAGTYSLVVTETALDGETAQSAPYAVTVTPPGSFGIKAEAAGPVAGGSVVPYDGAQPNLVAFPVEGHPNGITDGSGMAAVANQSVVQQPGSTVVNNTDAGGVELEGGQDALTGLAVPLNLSAPPGASVITPGTSLLNQADVDAESGGLPVSAIDEAYENSRIDAALGLPATVDLSAADPLATAKAGDAALLLKNIELLDTVDLLTTFTENGTAGAQSADPLHTIDASLGIQQFEGFLGGKAPAINTHAIDFTSAAQVLAWMTTYDSTPIFGSLDTIYDPSVLPQAAAIIAASNAAIEAHAATATSTADAVSYALAIERVAVSEEEQTFAGLASSFNLPVTAAQQQAGFTALQTEFTGPGLSAAVATALAQTVQVTSFTAAATTSAAAQALFTITFSTPVGGVTAGDFTLAGSAGLAGAAVSAVTPVAGSDSAAYTVSVHTGVGAGTLTLGFTPNGLTHANGLPLATGAFADPQFYSSPVALASEDAPRDLAIGDFNGDGLPDVLTAQGAIDGLALDEAQSGGSFVAEPAIYTGPTDVTRVVTGDFNGDGKLDAVTLNVAYSARGDLTVSALLGNGDGTFSAPVATDVGAFAGDIVTGDFNSDGKLDLAVLAGGGVKLFYGNGDGSFTAGPSAGIDATVGVLGNAAGEMAEADLNGDGKADLVIGTISPNTGAPGVVILLGDGHGGFTVTDQPSLGLGPGAALIAVGDVNGDGIPDIAAVPVTTGSTETAAVLLGNGDGTFQPAASVALPLPPGGSGTIINGNDVNEALSIGDVTGDGHADIVVANNESGVAVVQGNGDGTFGQGYIAEPSTSSAARLALADVNGDGLLDLVTTNDSGNEAGTSVGPGISVSLNTTQTVLPATAGVTIDRAAQAQPTLVQASGPGSLTHTGNAYTLNLGTLGQNSAAVAVVALANAAAAPADSFDGAFSAPNGSGFAITGAALASALAAGQSDAGLTFTADTSTPGAQSETLTFAPRDLTNDPAVTPAPPADLPAADAPIQTLAPANVNGGDVSLELSPITLTILDDVVPGGAPAVPVITGARAGQSITSAQTTQPFSPVTITDPASGASLTTTITLTAGGTATDADGTLAGGSLTKTGLGSYALAAAAPAAEQALLRALVFTPASGTGAGSAVTTGFGLLVSDGTATASDTATTVAVTQPNPPAVTLRLALDTGASATDGITADDVLVGSAGAGDSVTISNGAAVLGTALADGTGAYRFVPAGLRDGAYTLTATDAGAGDAVSASLAFTLDTAGPALSTPTTIVAGNQAASPIGITDSDNLETASQLTATITSLPTDGAVSLNNMAVQAGQVLTGSQLAQLAFTPTPGLSNVSSTLGYTLTDLAGNTSTGAATLGIGALTGSGAGDVHIVTFDGLHYDFQATGDFVVAEAAAPGAEDGFAVQMRAAEWSQLAGTSVATQLAARIGQDVVRFDAAGSAVTINGVSVPGLGATSGAIQFADGTLRQTGTASWLLSWNSGETLSVSGAGEYLNFAIAAGPQDGPGSLKGLLGSDSGQATDFQLADGTVLQQPLSQATILSAFADAWRVGPGPSLLDPPPATRDSATAAITPQDLAMTFLPPATVTPATVTLANMPGTIWTGSLGLAAPVEIQGTSAMLASGTLANLASGDLIDITDLFGATGWASYGTGTLQVADAGRSAIIRLAGPLPGSGLTLSSDAHGGLLLRV